MRRGAGATTTAGTDGSGNVAKILINCVVWGGLIAGALWAASYRCHQMTENMGIPGEFRLFAGCMVKPSAGRWIPLDNYQVVEPR